MIIRRWDDRIVQRKGKSISSGLVRGLILLLLLSLVLSAKALRGGRNCNHLPFLSPFLSASFSSGGHFQLYISFPLILAVHLLIIQVATGVPVPSDILLSLSYSTALFLQWSKFQHSGHFKGISILWVFITNFVICQLDISYCHPNTSPVFNT